MIYYSIDATIDSLFGEPKKKIHISEVICYGNETSINGCSVRYYKFEDGKHMKESVEVAGVICHPNDLSSVTKCSNMSAISNKTNSRGNNSHLMVVFISVITCLLFMIAIMIR